MKIIFVLVLVFSIKAQAMTLKQKFEKAIPGTFVVTSQDANITLFLLREKNSSQFIFSEVTIPHNNARSINWHDWAAKSFPGHSSWIEYSYNSFTNTIDSCFSYTKQSYLPTNELNSLFIPLINLNITPVAKDEQTSSGMTSRAKNEGFRPWTPPLFKNGSIVSNPSFDVYKASWPKDNTKLANSKLVMYFESSSESSLFPHWIQITEGPLKFKIHAIDSGSNLTIKSSKKRDFSAPCHGPSYAENGDLILSTLGQISEYQPQIYAINVNVKPKKKYLMKYEPLCSLAKHSYVISRKNLLETLMPNQNYIFIIKDDLDHIIESKVFNYVDIKPEL